MLATLAAFLSQVHPVWIGDNVQVCSPISDLAFHVGDSLLLVFSHFGFEARNLHAPFAFLLLSPIGFAW